MYLVKAGKNCDNDIKKKYKLGTSLYQNGELKFSIKDIFFDIFAKLKKVFLCRSPS